ncbi:hypothetical protein [Nonomuraea roseoviolacea]|uniref:DUF4352 domain-containing protein n=1 Tax=Nonomuraea roseoviolacea subsp. carminata TaxID=160689 RepID=A0ABT1JWH8_9ACTN|nr:hypothetical protein [Nonomuraea roseoviolacea]MCP2345762.1 hypothetical protein [Nonomuraea roseoviolacea subsp. carminata]
MRKTIALAVTAVALTGCGVIPGGQRSGSGSGEGGQAQQTTARTETTTAATTAPAAPQQTQVIASREASTTSGGQSGKARVDITGLKRQGRTATLTWTVTALDGKVNLHNGMGTATLDMTVSAVSLIDPVNAKRYRVARNGTSADSECVCSKTQGQFLENGATSSLYAVFAAPPADVTKINVEMPMIGVLTDVPIS